MSNKPRFRAESVILFIIAVLVAILIAALALPLDSHNSPLSTSPLLADGSSSRAWLPLTTGGPEHNFDFEGGTWKGNCWWFWPWARSYCSNEWNEINSPERWTTWFVEGAFCPRYQEYKTGRPEVLVIDLDDGFPDEERIYKGRKAVKMFTFWRCHIMGLYQTVSLQPGWYKVSLMAHSWCSNCSTRPYDPPYEEDCVTPITFDWGVLSVGIDPTGGTYYDSDNIQWGPLTQQYGKYSSPLESPWVYVDGVATIWFMSETSRPFKHGDVYIDNVWLEFAYE